MKFRSEYKYYVQFGEPNHVWSSVTRDGGIHLSIRGTFDKCYGGIELHYRRPTNYTEGPPDHNNCWLIGGPCWHDGSSLAAEEIWIPRWKMQAGDNDAMFRYLENELGRRLSEAFSYEVQ